MEKNEGTDQGEERKKFSWLWLLEIILILAAALWVGRNYLNFDPAEFIKGGEFTFTTLSHYAWNLLGKCGTCVFWNGYKNGGAPSFVEIHGAFLHPLVIWTSIQFGVLNGSKIVVLASLFLMGLGTWWLGKELHLGFVPRMWAALLTVAGGELFGRMQTGNVPLVLSIASASFILPSFLHLRRKPTTKSVIIAAIFLALLWLSGQGYSQIIIVVAYLPVLFWYLVREKEPRFALWKKVICAGLLSLLLVSVLLVPFIHFMGNWQKPLNRDLNSLQPLEYSVLNLVIRDKTFYDNQTLSKNPLPWSNINYIGWVPVILTCLGLIFLKKSQRKRELYLLYLIMALALIFSSRDPYALVKDWTFVQQFRFINVGASLAVQPLVLIAAITLEELFECRWTKTIFPFLSEKWVKWTLPVQWLILLSLVFFSIKSPYEFGRNYLTTQKTVYDNDILALFDTDSAQWVRSQSYVFLPFLMAKDEKVITVDRAWSWKDRQDIQPLLSLIDSSGVTDSSKVVKTIGTLSLVKAPDQIYAFVKSGDTIIPCEASSLGGQIDVSCTSDSAGTLVVREYYWSGWHAWVDGVRLSIDKANDFLTVPASSGNHIYRFRYQPWDVWVGMAMTLIGILFSGYLLFRKEKVQ